jgi:hypothetical protein
MTLRSRRAPRPNTPLTEYYGSVALPKPRRPENVADLSELAQPKGNFDRDAAFRDFVRGHACLLSADRNNECGGVTEFAHITTGGTSIKGSDFHGVPLCSNHHTSGPGAYHKLGSVEAFDSVHGTNLWRSNAELLAAFLRRRR